MARYTKFKSNYIRRNTHQTLRGGSTIYERDWLTIGGRLRFGADKTPVYGNGNFVFTRSKFPNYKKRHKLGTTVGEWTYENVENAKNDVNKVQSSEHSNDIRSYAYYGSSAEMIRASIEKIASTFPGIVTTYDTKIVAPTQDGSGMEEKDFVVVRNDYNYDFINNSANSYKYLATSHEDFLLNGEEITDYTVINRGMKTIVESCIQNIKELQYDRTTSGIQEHFEYECNNTYLSRGETYIDCKGNQQTAETDGNYDVRGRNTWNGLIPLLSSSSTSRSIALKKKTNGTYSGNVYLVISVNGMSDITISDTFFSTEYHDLNGGDVMRNNFRIGNNDATVKAYYDYYNKKIHISFNGINNPISLSQDNVTSIRLRFYVEESVEKEYAYLQTMDSTNSSETGIMSSWENVKCLPSLWLKNTSFKKVCDEEHEYVIVRRRIPAGDFYVDENGTLRVSNNSNTLRPIKEDDWHYVLYSQAFWDLSGGSNGYNFPFNEITIKTNSYEITLYEYILNNKMVYITPYSNVNFILKPKDEIIEDFFQSLDVFEKYLLNRETKPLYTSEFITPFEVDEKYYFYPRHYTWPSYGDGCIDISSIGYSSFINDIMNMAEKMDEVSTDNLYRKMTHEAIKNYDWTYTREYIDGDEEDNIFGGERMQKVIRVIGRMFDDVKRYIDGIKHVVRITYSGYDNIPNALLSDKLTENGWETLSTIPVLETTVIDSETQEEITIDKDMGLTKLTEDEIREFVENKEETEDVWYPSINVERYTPVKIDIDFMRILSLFTKRIFATKGTCQAIDMIMGLFGYGEDDYRLTEHYRTVTPINYDEPLSEEDDSTIGNTIITINNNFKNLELLYDDDTSGITVGSFIAKEYNDEEHTITYETYLIPYYNMERMYDGDLYYQQNGGWCLDLAKQPIYKALRMEDEPDPENEELINELIKISKKLIVNNLGEFDGECTVNYIGEDENNIGFQKYEARRSSDEGYALINFRTNGENLYYTFPMYENDEEKRISCLNEYGWQETLSYLHVVSNIESLLAVNPNSISFGEIYYVSNPSDYFQFLVDDELEEYRVVSNFFVVVNDFNPELLGSWKNIDLNDPNDEYYEKANYLNNIISINTGNNPHVGYSFYDKGETFFDYMKKPFKYGLDEGAIDFDFMENAQKIKFDISEDKEAFSNPTSIQRFSKEPDNAKEGEMYFNTNKNKLYIYENGNWVEQENNDKYSFKSKVFHDENFEDVNTLVINEATNEFEEYSDGAELQYKQHLYKTYDLKKIEEKKKETYYLNSKVLIFENLLKLEENEGENEVNYFKEYFKEVIMKYVMQVIPSTTILLLKNFD